MVLLGQMTCLLFVDRSFVGSLITDLVIFRSSRDLDIHELTESQLPCHHKNYPPVLLPLSVIVRFHNSLELMTYPSFNAHNEGGLVCVVLDEEGADVKGM